MKSIAITALLAAFLILLAWALPDLCAWIVGARPIGLPADERFTLPPECKLPKRSGEKIVAFIERTDSGFNVSCRPSPRET